MEVSEEDGSFKRNSKGKGPGAEMSRGREHRRTRPLRREQNSAGQSGGAEVRVGAEDGSPGTLQTTRTLDFIPGVMQSH